MAKTKRCVRITKIAEELTDQTIKSYEAGRMEDFWNGISSLQMLQEVKVVTCGEHIE